MSCLPWWVVSLFLAGLCVACFYITCRISSGGARALVAYPSCLRLGAFWFLLSLVFPFYLCDFFELRVAFFFFPSFFFFLCPSCIFYLLQCTRWVAGVRIHVSQTLSYPWSLVVIQYVLQLPGRGSSRHWNYRLEQLVPRKIHVRVYMVCRGTRFTCSIRKYI